MIYYYLIFCLTTAICSWYEIFNPVLKNTKYNKTERAIGATVLIIMAGLLAPLYFIACVVPSIGQKSREHLAKHIE